MTTSTLPPDGYAVIEAIVAPAECLKLIAALATEPGATSGSRCLLSRDWCKRLAARLRAHPGIAALLPAGHVASQCTFFTKSASINWLVPIHQDLSIPVAERVDAPGLGGWSEKEGGLFVQPPIALLERLVAVRLHLDDCGPDDGPLHIVPGSHTRGKISPDDAATARRQEGVVSCEVGAGGVLVMQPLLLHASSKASGASQRRVLHFLFGPEVLPHGLRWHTAV